MRWLTAVLLALGALTPIEVFASCKQPLYVITHRCNDAADVPNEVAASGVNAIEADFSWGRPTIFTYDRWVLEHDPWVNVNSVDLDDWLGGVQLALAQPNSPLSLIILDIKDPDGPLDELYTKVRGALPNVNLIFSIPDFELAKLHFHKIKAQVNADPRAGVAVDYLVSGETQAQVKAFFEAEGYLRYWLADGYNITDNKDSVDQNITDAIAIRDSSEDCSEFHGVYAWTYEKQSSIVSKYIEGVNGLFVNSDVCHDIVGIDGVWTPAEVVDFVKTLPQKFAVPTDNPFSRMPVLDCADDVKVECSVPGGVYGGDPQLSAFFASVNCTSDYCDPLQLTNDAPLMFPLGATPVTFTATGDAQCTTDCSATVTVQDTTSPLVTCPADIVQDPVSLQGNTVEFNATASDVCDAAVTAQCDHPSGSLFAPGAPTPVTCTAKDASNNAVSCTFNVKIFTPEEVVANLKSAVAALSLNQGQMKSILAILDALLDAIADENNEAICGELTGFMTKITQWVGAGVLTSAEAEPLLTSAKNLRKTFGCQ